MGVITGNETGLAYIRATACNFTSPVTFATASAGSNGKIVIDLVENDPASSEQFFAENFNVYPNPTTDILNIVSKNGLTAGEIKVTDMTGKVVRTLKNSTTLNVSDLASGTYLIDITTNGGKASSKFVKK